MTFHPSSSKVHGLAIFNPKKQERNLFNVLAMHILNVTSFIETLNQP